MVGRASSMSQNRNDVSKINIGDWYVSVYKKGSTSQKEILYCSVWGRAPGFNGDILEISWRMEIHNGLMKKKSKHMASTILSLQTRSTLNQEVLHSMGKGQAAVFRSPHSCPRHFKYLLLEIHLALPGPEPSLGCFWEIHNSVMTCRKNLAHTAPSLIRLLLYSANLRSHTPGTYEAARQLHTALCWSGPLKQLACPAHLLLALISFL
jgi:hypothetical protein